MPKVYEQVYAIVRQIPKGKILTYGLISNMIDARLSAQGVGWALKALASEAPGKQKRSKKDPKDAGGKTTSVKELRVPWHRVINSQGGISTHKNPNIPPGLQRVLLEAEGVRFNDEEKADLDKHLWKKGLTSDRSKCSRHERIKR